MSTVKRMKFHPRAGGSKSKSRSNKLRFFAKDGERKEISVEDIENNLQYLKENKDLHVKNIVNDSELEHKFNTFRTSCDLLFRAGEEYAKLTDIIQKTFQDVPLHPGTIGAFVAGDFTEDVGKGFSGPDKYNPIRAAATPSTNKKPVEKIDKRILLFYPETDGRMYKIAGPNTARDAYIFVYLTGKPVSDISLDPNFLKSSGLENIYVYTYNEIKREFSDVTQKQSFIVPEDVPKIASTNTQSKEVSNNAQRASTESISSSSNEQRSSLWLLILIVIFLIAIGFFAYYFLYAAE